MSEHKLADRDAKGRFIKGHPKLGGRKAGVGNHISRANIEGLQDIIHEYARECLRKRRVTPAIRLLLALGVQTASKERRRERRRFNARKILGRR